jgi:histidyl-tRNA synthetase
MGRPKKQAGSGPHKVSVIAGTSDIVTDTDRLWATVLRHFQETCKTYGFARVETPLVEDQELYRSFYNDAPEHMKQLVPVPAGDKAWVLRENFLPSMLRAYTQRKLSETVLFQKWVATGSVSRQNDKGAIEGEQRFNFEVLGTFNHLTEAQIIGALWQLLEALDLTKEVTLEINHIGSSESQAAFEPALADYLSNKKFSLCDSCTELFRTRPLAVMRCDEVECKAVIADGPTILDFLDQDSHKHFTSILEALDELAVPYQLNSLYAGTEGTTRTAVVVKHKHGDRVSVLARAGYHDSLMQRIAGKNICAFGLEGSLTKIHEVLERANADILYEPYNEVFLVPLGELAARKSLKLFQDLTTAQVTVYDNFGTQGVKDQLKAAQASKSPIALIMGQKEALDEMVILRDVKSGMQEVFSYDKIVDEVKKRLGR